CRSKGVRLLMVTSCIRLKDGEFSTACRHKFNTYSNCSSLATAGNGTPATLRARRMRLPRTTSRSGPLPFIHSLNGRLMMSRSDIARPSSAASALRLVLLPFQRPQPVPQLCRPLVLLFRDGRLQLLPQALDLPAAAQRAARPGRHLAGVMRPALDTAQHRFELLVKGLPALAAAQMTQTLEVGEGQAAVGAAQPGPGRRRADARTGLQVEKPAQELVDAEHRLQPHLALPAGTRLAQVRLALLAVDELRHMHRGFRLPAVVAQHRGRPPPRRHPMRSRPSGELDNISSIPLIPAARSKSHSGGSAQSASCRSACRMRAACRRVNRPPCSRERRSPSAWPEVSERPMRCHTACSPDASGRGWRATMRMYPPPPRRLST